MSEGGEVNRASSCGCSGGFCVERGPAAAASQTAIMAGRTKGIRATRLVRDISSSRPDPSSPSVVPIYSFLSFLGQAKMNKQTEDCLLVLTRHRLRAVCASPDTPGRGTDFELRISPFAPKPGACTLPPPGLFSGGFQNAARFFRIVRMNHLTRRNFFLT